MAIAGLDIGTSRCKCTIFNDDGDLSSYSYSEYPLEKGPRGYMELNPAAVWKATCEVIKKALMLHKGSGVRVLCITSFGEAGVLIDKNDNVLYNSMLYTDPRGAGQCGQLIDILGRAEIMARSGLNPHPMYSACKLMWLRDNESRLFNNIDSFMQYSDYILYKLSGEKYIDWSLASRTLMFNVIEKCWDEKLLSAAGLNGQIFSQPVKAGIPVANINRSAAQITGLSTDTALILGGHDQIAAAVGAGILKPGQAVNGMGSVDCITPVFDRPVINKTMGDAGYACVPYVLPDHYVTYAFNYSGGAMIKWYMDNFAQNDSRNERDKAIQYELLEECAPREPTDLLVLPHLLGAATPYMDISASGAIIGVTLQTDKCSLYRGLMEGAAYELKINIDRLKKAGVEFNKLTACGGGGQSSMWVQIKSDIFGMPIDVLEVKEAGTLGAAIMGGVSCGLYNSLEEGINQFVKVKNTFYPNPKNRRKYQEQYEKYLKIYDCVKYIQRNKGGKNADYTDE